MAEQIIKPVSQAYNEGTARYREFEVTVFGETHVLKCRWIEPPEVVGWPTAWSFDDRA